MAISAKDVKTLREKTGVGMMDCKLALDKCNGDMEKAVIFLREKGLAGVQKRAGRVTAEGKVHCMVKDNKAVMVEVNSETDFVSRNEKFQAFVKEVAEHVMAGSSYENKALDNASEEMAKDSWYAAKDRKVSDILADKIATIGENLNIRRVVSYVAKKGGIASYVHGAGKIGVLVEYAAEKNSDEANSIVRDVAMHIAAINPGYLSKDDVTQDDLTREEAIYRKQLKDQGKPDNIIDKILKGKMGKFYSEVCLLNQAFVKEPSLTVQKYLEEEGKKLGVKLEILRFVRYQVGEGMEK